MADDPDPPRKTFQLKPREFESVNHPPRAPAHGGQKTGRDPGPNETDGGRIDVRDLCQQGNFGGKRADRPKRSYWVAIVLAAFVAAALAWQYLRSRS